VNPIVALNPSVAWVLKVEIHLVKPFEHHPILHPTQEIDGACLLTTPTVIKINAGSIIDGENPFALNNSLPKPPSA
jgi:hypothetical protein